MQCAAYVVLSNPFSRMALSQAPAAQLLLFFCATLVACGAVFTAALVATPVIAVIVLAARPAPDVWQHLIDYVLPLALWDTALLLLGVGLVALGAGAGSAWLISLHDFPGRGLLLWLLPLPLAIPTYIAAYVYVDLFEPLGLVHRTLTLWLPSRDALTLLACDS